MALLKTKANERGEKEKEHTIHRIDRARNIWHNHVSIKHIFKLKWTDKFTVTHTKAVLESEKKSYREAYTFQLTLVATNDHIFS